MAEVLFHPNFARVLEQVAARAVQDGEIDVECRPGLDPVVIAGQIQRYAAGLGVEVRCRARSGRVEVRAEASALGQAG